MKWNDENRFSQDGYSKATVFPKVENYKNYEYFLEDLAKATERENDHREWMEEMRYEHLNYKRNLSGEEDE